MKNIVAFLLIISFIGGTASVSANESIVGKWYGFVEGSPVSVEFKRDQTFSMKIDAASNMSFECKYKFDDQVTPAAIDLIGIPGGMVCVAIITLKGNEEMEFFGYFGVSGQVQRPEKIDTNSPSQEAIYMNLSRNSNILSDYYKLKDHTNVELAFERNKALGKGVNLSGVFDGMEYRPIKPEIIRMIAEAGFKSVRLPVRWATHCSDESPYTINPSFLANVDNIVQACTENGLAVIIDNHYYPMISFAGHNDLSWDENINRFYSIWEQLAVHYKNYSDKVYFDIMNEPNKALGAGWNQLVKRTLEIIRKTNPDRTVLVCTPSLGQSFTIGMLDLPVDDWNIIVEIHYYLPHLFTHQGMPYVPGAMSAIGTKWTGTVEEKSQIESDLGFCAKWGKAHFRPINIGEFGVNSNADITSRANYLKFMRETAEKYDMSFNIWTLTRDRFGIFDEESNEWHQPLLNALIE